MPYLVTLTTYGELVGGLPIVEHVGPGVREEARLTTHPVEVNRLMQENRSAPDRGLTLFVAMDDVLQEVQPRLSAAD